MIRCLAVSVCLVLMSAAVHAADKERNIRKGSLESRVDALAAIQPGLGVVMHEFGYRFANAYWAANGGNWGLAQYQLEELREAKEVAEVTRPRRAPMLNAFEAAYLVPVDKAIDKKDIAQFNRAFSAAVEGCNACHAASGVGFIRYRVPEQSKYQVLDFNLKTEPKYHESAEPK